MDETDVIASLAALAQPTRLATFRLLVAQDPTGMAAGDIGRALAVTQNTMSAHLAVLSRAGLLRAERKGRSIVYRADLARFRAMTLYLVSDCCGGRPELCTSLVAELSRTSTCETASP